MKSTAKNAHTGRRARVLSAPATHWGPSQTTAGVHVNPDSIDVIVRNPACFSTAPAQDMAEHRGTTIIIRLTRRQLTAWLKRPDLKRPGLEEAR